MSGAADPSLAIALVVDALNPRKFERFLLFLSAVHGTVRRLMSPLYEAWTTPL
jgi:hypothetical protein